MSGTALTMVSPSSVSTRRRVVCVAGCCGPKLRVYRNSWSAPAMSLGTSCSTGISTFRTRDGLEVVAFAITAERVVFSQRKRGEFARHQDAAQVRVAVEADSEHVEHLSFHPVGPLPETDHRWKFGLRVVGERPDENSFARRRGNERVDHAVTIGGIRVIEIVDPGNVAQEIEAALDLQTLQNVK